MKTLNKIFKLEDLKVDISGKVNTDKVGKYIVVYKSSTDYQKKEVIRIICIIWNEITIHSSYIQSELYVNMMN